jgi:hypothetical protein
MSTGITFTKPRNLRGFFFGRYKRPHLQHKRNEISIYSAATALKVATKWGNYRLLS